MIMIYHHVSDIQAILIAEKEFKIQSMDELIESKYFNVFSVEKSSAQNIIEKVSF